MIGVEIVQWLSPDLAEKERAEARLAELWMQHFRPRATTTSAPNEAGVWANTVVMIMDADELDRERAQMAAFNLSGTPR